MELLLIDDLIKEGKSLETDLCGIVDDGFDNVMSITIMEDEKKYRALVVADTDADREKAMLLWQKHPVTVELTKSSGVIIMKVLEVGEPVQTPVVAGVKEVTPEMLVKNPLAPETQEKETKPVTASENEERLKNKK